LPDPWVRILATLLKPDRGRAWVAGFDVARNPAAVRRLIGLSGQYAAVDPFLTGQENLVMIGRLYGLFRRRAAPAMFQIGRAGDDEAALTPPRPCLRPAPRRGKQGVRRAVGPRAQALRLDQLPGIMRWRPDHPARATHQRKRGLPTRRATLVARASVVAW
jgi:hypothetical protein